MNSLEALRYESQISEMLKIASRSIFGHPGGGLYFLVSAEIEFYILDNNKTLDLESPKIQSLFKKIVAIGKQYKIIVENIEKEEGLAQFEIQTSPTKNAFLLANFIKEMQTISADILGIDMSGKGSMEHPGSGIHFHFSLYECNSMNLFCIPGGKGKFSEIMEYAIGGLLKTMPESMIYFAPTENCYHRFHVPISSHEIRHKYNPTNYSWGINNRTCAIRVPSSITHSEQDVRLEHRVCSSFCLPHESIMSIINGICYGVVKKTVPPKPIFGDSFLPMYSNNCTRLPFFLKEARSMSKDIEEMVKWIEE